VQLSHLKTDKSLSACLKGKFIFSTFTFDYKNICEDAFLVTKSFCEDVVLPCNKNRCDDVFNYLDNKKCSDDSFGVKKVTLKKILV
jgi:hypothetical protein